MEPAQAQALLRVILGGYSLNPWGTHGVGHWARVLENGRRLAGMNGADLEVVELFALLHDARRRNDWIDPGHGRRGAVLAKKLQGDLFRLPDEDLRRLMDACANHTRGASTNDLTIQTCWDADRLDLPRAGIQVNPAKLSTPAARDPQVMAWAEARSLRGAVPAWVPGLWGLTLQPGLSISND